ncbi:MAG: DUF2723 domain-containing protein [bacterium]
MQAPANHEFDRTNAFIAAGVWLFSFIVYLLTVQPTFSFWDCGEFVACANILGIPHPPGTPLFVLIGRIFAMTPFVDDIGYRVNFISVISSAFTAMFSYLLTVRLVRCFFDRDGRTGLSRLIAYVGGIAGAFFVAFSATNWGNSVEAEVYGLALALSVAIVWMTYRYWESRGTPAATKWMILAFYTALLGVAIHMSVFLVVPVCAIFFIFKDDATARDWLMVCGFVVFELLLTFLMAGSGAGGVRGFYAITGILSLALLWLLWKRINWAIVIAIAASSSLMIDFSTYVKAAPIAFVILIVMALLSKQQGWKLQWKVGLAILVIGFIGISVHGYIPIRSAHNPRIDENNPSRDFRTFMNYLDRKQYGQMGMVERMFKRRGTLSNQFGRHAHMGFWSFFEEQYSSGGSNFIFPFFALGLIGLIVAIRKRIEIGVPFFTLLLVMSVGLVLYMNFADGTQYDPVSGDAYLEVRDRDYFFTPAFVFFGVAMGMGIAAVMQLLRERLQPNPGLQKNVVFASAVLVLLPGVTLAKNWHECNRADNYIPYYYAKNLMDCCEPNAVLFTSGDNDTFPLWCMQEVYNYRRDIRVVNLSLLNTDWYVYQMKDQYDVPISLSAEQILWNPVEVAPGIFDNRPDSAFVDRARRKKAYLRAYPLSGRVIRVQDMMVDEIVWESTYKEGDSLKLRQPIYFSSPPYGESPLGLRDYVQVKGLLYKLDWNFKDKPQVDVDASYKLFMEEFRYDGYADSKIYREENATGVYLTVGVNGGRLYDELMARGSRDSAVALAEKLIEVYPEYWQTYMVLAQQYDHEGDSARADAIWHQLHDTLTAFSESNKRNLFYTQDLGLAKVELGQRIGDQDMISDGVELCWQAFNANSNASYAFRKLITVLTRTGRISEVQKAARQFAAYGINLEDPFLQQLLSMGGPPPAPGAGSSGQ